MSKILVFGELCNDKFVYGRCERLNPEAPTPVFTTVWEDNNDGMAGNTFNNLCTLSNEQNQVLFWHQKEIITKMRIVDEASGYILIRLDYNDQAKRIEDLERKLNPISDPTLLNLSAIVISDYNKGFLTEKDIEFIAKKAKEWNVPVFLDTKKILGAWSKEITFVKINEKEYKQQLAINSYPQGLCKNLIVTFGSKGAKWFYAEDEAVVEFPTRRVDVRDVSGAGDTFLAGMVTEYVRSKDVYKAVHYANLAASVAVSKRGVVFVRKDEVDELLTTN
jgi:D-glycero-beta-D-manno-heptose-7-phosphate kinase